MGQKSLDRETLNANGIQYDNDNAEPVTYDELSRKYADVALVLEGLLDFDGILTDSCYRQLDKDSRSLIEEKFPASRIPSLQKCERESPKRVQRYQEEHQIAYQEERFELAQEIARKAEKIEAPKEARWSELIKNDLFGRLIRLAREAEGEQHFKARKVIEMIRVEAEDTWHRAQVALNKTTPKASPQLKSPKVDLYIALPIISRSLNTKGFYRDDYVQNFNESRLTALSNWDKLISCPIKDLSSSKNIARHHLVCFPSAIVEIKHHRVPRSEREYCVYQAANASSSALAMLNQLSRYSRGKLSLARIRPIVSFTFIGPSCRVWLTYIDSKVKGPKRKEICKYTMRCIWKGNLRNIWDSVQLCCIIENLHYWTLHHFRPWVSSCLDQWCLQSNITGENAKLSEDEDGTESSKDGDGTESIEDEDGTESIEDEDGTESIEDEDSTESIEDEDSTESIEDEDSTNDVRTERFESDQDNEGRQAGQEDKVDGGNGDSGVSNENQERERHSDKTERSRKPTSGFKIGNRDFAGDDNRDEQGKRDSLEEQSPTPYRKSLFGDRDTKVSSSEISDKAFMSLPIRTTPDGKLSSPWADTLGSPHRQADTTSGGSKQNQSSIFGSGSKQCQIDGQDVLLGSTQGQTALFFGSEPGSEQDQKGIFGSTSKQGDDSFLESKQKPTSLFGLTSRPSQDQISPFSTGPMQDQSSIFGSGSKQGQNTHSESTQDKTTFSFGSEPGSEQDQKSIFGSTFKQGGDSLLESKQKPTSLFGLTSKPSQGQTSTFNTGPMQDQSSIFGSGSKQGQDAHSESTQDKNPLFFGSKSGSEQDQSAGFGAGPKQGQSSLFSPK